MRAGGQTDSSAEGGANFCRRREGGAGVPAQQATQSLVDQPLRAPPSGPHSGCDVGGSHATAGTYLAHSSRGFGLRSDRGLVV
mmetsp:Transcript_30051/g.47121  ORF Transcript_30051/g.47121 Transcript_30051/m.47121 type:complete len:83 (+) Transcript_30051:22-270(+)